MRPSRRQWTCGVSILGLLALAVGLGWVVARLREETRSSNCTSNLAQLALALDNYEAAYGVLPPAAITDAHGKPLLSWRVALLPFMEENLLYRQIKLDEPWNGPNNRRFNAMRPPNFACPSHRDAEGKGYTSYVVVVGPRTLFPGGGRSRKRADIRDDPASTIVVVESTMSSINWMEPRDLEWDQMSFRLNDPSRPSISSDHYSGSYPGPHVIAAGAKAYPDNQVVATLVGSMTPDTIKSLLVIDDGDMLVLRRGPL
jgi:Protein of unknown function (DUF1559)